MSDEGATAENLRHAFDGFWIQNNIGFLARYWHTATEALQKVAEAPEEFSEFENNELGPNYVAAVLDNHLENHNYSGVLLTYSIFDEFMSVLTAMLGEVRSAPIGVNELRDRGVRRYKKFIHKVCRVREDEADIDWGLLQDLAVVRNAIIHAHGNKSGTPTNWRQSYGVARGCRSNTKSGWWFLRTSFWSAFGASAIPR